MNHTENYNERNTLDLAENKFVELLESKSIVYKKFGFDNDPIPVKDFIKLPQKLRSMPDFIVFQNQPIFVEVKGCKDVLRLKDSDTKSYSFWSKLILPVTLFVYSSTFNSYKLIPFRKVLDLLPECEADRYHDNNKLYYKIKWEMIK
jgi:hypothetical protein